MNFQPLASFAECRPISCRMRHGLSSGRFPFFPCKRIGFWRQGPHFLAQNPQGVLNCAALAGGHRRHNVREPVFGGLPRDANGPTAVCTESKCN